MKITHISNHDQFDPDSHSGTPFWISKGLENEGVELDRWYLDGPLKLLPPLEELAFRFKKLWVKLYKRADIIPDYFTQRAVYIADKLKKPLANHKTDAILISITPSSGAFLETKIPIVYWTDAIYSSLVGFYPNFRFHHVDTIWDGHIVTDACLRNAKLLIFSSEWAARTAVEIHGISKDKIKIVPFGANLEITHTLADVEKMVKARERSRIKFLFVGKQWFRKGGDIVLEVAKELDAAGYPIEVTIVGELTGKSLLPAYVKCVGLISKKSTLGIDKLKQLYKDTHFLFLPSRADCCPIAFAEANAFGVPCITSYVGGIPDAIKDGINGMTFSLESTVKQYCDYIINLWENYAYYEALALSSYNEYQTRLNWQTSAQQVKKLITEL